MIVKESQLLNQFRDKDIKYHPNICNNFKYLRSQKGEIFWRTCFDANLICVNHDDKIDLKKNKRFIYISKY